MIIRNGTYRVEKRENARGGSGTVELHHLAEPEMIFNKGRMLVRTVIRPGGSMGYHVHRDEMEFFYILKGTAKVDDNGEECILYPGDTMCTGDGQGHSIEAYGDEDLEYLAIVIKK